MRNRRDPLRIYFRKSRGSSILNGLLWKLIGLLFVGYFLLSLLD